MEKSAYFIGTQTESLLAIPADWEHSTGNTPYFNRYNLEQIKGMSEGFTSKFPYKIVTTIEWSKKKKVPLTLCVHTCENILWKLTKPTKAQKIAFPLHMLVFLALFSNPILKPTVWEAYHVQKCFVSIWAWHQGPEVLRPRPRKKYGWRKRDYQYISTNQLEEFILREKHRSEAQDIGRSNDPYFRYCYRWGVEA